MEIPKRLVRCQVQLRVEGTPAPIHPVLNDKKVFRFLDIFRQNQNCNF